MVWRLSRDVHLATVIGALVAVGCGDDTGGTGSDTGTSTDSTTGDGSSTGPATGTTGTTTTGTTGTTDTTDTDTGNTTTDTGDTETGTTDTDTETGTTDTDTDTTTTTTTDVVTDCSGHPDFTLCSVVTSPDRSYDICVDEVCVSPGCGTPSCNVPGPHFPLADTGQDSCWKDGSSISCPVGTGDDLCEDDGTPEGCGQDAQYGWDVSGGGRFGFDASVSSEVIVGDTVTDLQWMRCVDGQTGSDCSGDGAELATWADALEVCDQSTWGGYDDWRVPDTHELLSIVDFGSSGTTIDTSAFANSPATAVWTNETYANISVARGWNVAFDTGELEWAEKTSTLAVRCVRGGPTPHPQERYLDGSGGSIDGSDEMTMDEVTGLMWQRSLPETFSGCSDGTPSGSTCSWVEALGYCEGLTHGGFSDWRLPNLKELDSIIDRRNLDNSNSTPFPDGANFTYSSTPNELDSGAGWYLRFNFGDTSSGSFSLSLRCVRDP